MSVATFNEADIAQQLDASTARKVAVSAMVGTALEWYDFFLFSTAAALVFNKQYFVSHDPLVATLASFGTLAVGFVARPIGGLIFGHMGDRLGRRRTLMITIVGIGAITGIIGLLPTYAGIGIAAPVALIVLRLLQGLAVGGEWGGAVTIAVEHAPAGRRARFAAMPQLGSPIGTLMSSGGFFLVSLMSKDSFDAWGWRIPFLLAFPLLLVAVLIRRHMEESPMFRKLAEAEEMAHAPIKEVVATSPWQIVVGLCTALLGIGGFYLVTTFVISYGTTVLGLSSRLMLLGTLVAALFEIGVIITGGRLGERFGASRVAVAGALASAALAFPVFLGIQTRIPVVVVLSMALGVAVLSYPYSVSGTLLTGLFPAKLRYTGVALSSNLAGVVSGFVPMIATALLAASGKQWWPAAVFLMVISLITVIGSVIAPRVSIPELGIRH
ncbi:MFS transporter [Raineyella sp. W15-4]|uniref:MFS transporter n=1 Tax=Raineyella sp. W15-4 TaxID=3081651 RepID=UPI00295534E6|nr:MFS transporter [Raineyella sp. W15-4]WOQ17878.1 MFS transporter [Raineyella sp. W15-4]